jgi:hypothetical protein
MELNNKEKELLKTIGLYFSEGGKDGDFYKLWIDNWTMGEINELEKELLDYCAEVDWDVPDFFILCIPISVTFKFLLWKLTEKKPQYSLSIDKYR